MMQSVKNLSIASISNVKVISTLVQSVTEKVDEINRDTAVRLANLSVSGLRVPAIDLGLLLWFQAMATDVLTNVAATMNTLYADVSIEDIKQGAQGAILGLGNLIYVSWSECGNNLSKKTFFN